MLSTIDILLFFTINNLPHNRLLDLLAIIIHFISYIGILLVLWLFYEWFSQEKQKKLIGKLGLIVLVLTTILGEFIIKNLVQRPRPYVTLSRIYDILPNPGGFSFPSTQTAITAALATLYILILPKTLRCYFFIFLAFITAFDRIYMGHHYPSDVIAGAILGVITSFICYTWSKLSHLPQPFSHHGKRN